MPFAKVAEMREYCEKMKAPFDKKAYMREYREKNREKLKEQNRLSNLKRIDEKREYNRTYMKSYDPNPCKKYAANWRSRGVKLRENEDWESVYLFWLSCENCEACGKDLDGKPNLDHDHTTGFIRDVVCVRCNNVRRFEDAQ